MDSLDCSAAALVVMVSFRQRLRPPRPAIQPHWSSMKNAAHCFLTRPPLFPLHRLRVEDLGGGGGASLFRRRCAARKVARAHRPERYPLAQAAEAHRDLEGRRTTGRDGG